MTESSSGISKRISDSTPPEEPAFLDALVAPAGPLDVDDVVTFRINRSQQHAFVVLSMASGPIASQQLDVIWVDAC